MRLRQPILNRLFWQKNFSSAGHVLNMVSYRGGPLEKPRYGISPRKSSNEKFVWKNTLHMIQCRTVFAISNVRFSVLLTWLSSSTLQEYYDWLWERQSLSTVLVKWAKKNHSTSFEFLLSHSCTFITHEN